MAATEGEITVDATLLFRRAFVTLKTQKSCEFSDIVMDFASTGS